MTVDVPQRRSVVTEEGGVLAIAIPAARHIFPLLFLPFWLFMWYQGETSALRDVGKHGVLDLFVLVWLTFWTAGGIAAALLWVWMSFGVEVVSLGTSVLSVRRKIGPVGITRDYDLTHVRNLRVSLSQAADPKARQSRSSLVVPFGTIAFDYGAKTIRFGGVEEAEAAQIVRDLVTRRPSLIEAA